MKKLQKLFAMLLVFCMAMSLLSVNAFADEVNDGGESPAEEEPVAGPVYRCQKDEHPHRDGCYQENWTCQLHVHETACYDAEQNLICAKEASRDLICDAEEHVHTPDCYHVHGITCYPLECDEKYDCDKQYDCDKLYDCESSEEGHMCSDATCAKHVCLSDSCTAHVCGDSCKDHAHVDGCYDTAADRVCGKNEVEPYCEKVEYTHGEGCYKLHEHVLGTAEESGCYQLLLTCDKEEHTHSNACIPPSEDYYIREPNKNINLTLYNYGSYINVGADRALQFGWHNNLYNDPNNSKGRPYEGIDGPAMKTTGEVFKSYAEIYYSNKLYNYPTVERLLNEDGYPQIAAKQIYKNNRNSKEIVDVSLEYLFSKDGPALKTGAAPNPLSDYSKLREEATFIENSGFNSNYESMRFDMVGDGGLFEITEDGYYYYNCNKTSAYYDQTAQCFLLSDVLIGPGHDGPEMFRESKNYARNFLPFNKIDFSNADQFYQYSDSQWTYITDYAINSDSAREDLADLWFGFDMDFEFFMPKDGKVNGKDMTFQFQGDDDIWVYIDDVLVLDIAGCHGAVLGEINFATGEVNDPNYGLSNHDTIGALNGVRNYTTLRTLFENALGDDFDKSMFDGQTFADYTKHEFKFFYTERGGNISYCALKFNIPQLPTDSLSVGKAIETTDGSEIDFITDALSYEFRVLKADENGTATNELYIPAGTEFSIVAQDNYENVLGSGTVDEDGCFLLKDGQVALFPEVMKTYGNYKYVVEERIPEAFSGTYGEVEYTAANQSVTTEVKTEDNNPVEYLTYYTPALAADETQVVTFTNKIKVDKTNPTPITADLTITKTESGSTQSERQGVYQFFVQAGYADTTMQPLSIGTKYTVGGVEKTVAKEGILQLKANETATLTFLAGTSYKVEEIVDSRYTYTPSYQNAEGMIAVDNPAKIEAVVTNTYYDLDSDDSDTGGSGTGGSGTGSGTGTNTDPDTSVDIEDEDTPLAGGVEIEDEDTPLAGGVEIEDEDTPLASLPDEEVPLAVLPATGDASALWMVLSALSGAGLFLTGKKREEE